MEASRTFENQSDVFLTAWKGLPDIHRGGWLLGCLAGPLASWLAGLLGGRLAGWLAG